ncbi:hypothetical protein [Streptomyces aureocirculatus]|uniref:hypothetical protein n=1 Tax=Streptomyces aureocirculatus TaxID=67275 RepID=UPI00068BCB9D|nr:hypothetical protein [Streptomyces aureocirculatus]
MRLTAKAAVPVTALVLAAGAGAAYYTSVGTEKGSGADSGTYQVAAPGKVAQAYVGSPDDPATWRLPTEAYMPTATQARVVTQSRDRLLDQCMSAAGYDAWKPAPDLPEIGGKTLTDWRYGVHDARLSAERGYHPAEGEQEAYDKAMEAGAVDESGADDATLRGCVEKVDGKVPDTTPPAIVQEISGKSFLKSQKAPEVVDVFAKWSSCMKDKGHGGYKRPLDASDDPRFTDPDKVTDQEIATAKDDIACRDTYDVARTWFDAESKIQRDEIAKHLKDFDKAAAATREAVAKAKEA